jgi:hypothetical protein
MVIFMVFACLTCSRHSGWSKFSKKNHIVTFILNDSLFVEKYEVFSGGGPTVCDSSSYFITDSIHFRKYVGTKFDEGSEKMRWIINDSNEVVFYLVSENFPAGLDEILDSIEKTEKDPQKLREKRTAAMQYVYDTTRIGQYNIQELIKEGKFE